MTSRPGPGIHESLQSRASVHPPRSHLHRQPSKPHLNTAHAHPDCIDPTLDAARPPFHHVDASPAPVTTRPLPRGRPPLFFTSAAADNACELPPAPSPHHPIANLPLPPRPGSLHLREASQQARIVPGGSGVKDPPTLQPPEALAPPVHFLGGKPADVFPWTGTNPEDTLSEPLVKVGISNKPQIMNETNTARPSLWSNLKNKSGLTTLSTLFVAVLEKRQQSGRLQTPNTFKPPPRLTLRDSTREQWLHDLAVPTTGLRRLSRTIPHGLTGKVLLEQCLNKNIPLPRALWLAKCVGINELRAHKRKGQAGTVTWVRGWTSSAEQFLDASILTLGSGDWKPRITYALQFVTHLYKENLLDDDHFLDWILHGLDACPTERLFLWLLIVSVPHYWKDLTSCRWRGKRLAQSLLNHIEKLYLVESQRPFSTALQYLENVVVKLVMTRPTCLLLPESWSKYSLVLHNLGERRSQSDILHAIKKLDERNRRLSSSPTNTLITSQTSAGRVYSVLDSVRYDTTIRIENLSNDCMEIISNAPHLISALLQWASSSYRQGSHRVYLAIRLLRKWAQLGADVYESIVSYLHNLKWTGTTEPRIIFRIIAELVRSKTFPAGRYLQWLIATGSLGSDADTSSSASWPVQLITEIPLSGLSDQVRTLRCTLLRGTAYSAELEEQVLGSSKHSISQTLPALCGLAHVTGEFPKVDTDPLSATVKLELGVWLRHQVAQYTEVNMHVPTKEPSVEETAVVSLINLQDFHTVRFYLERFEDLAILADVVGVATSSLDSGVLASATDTMHYHLKAFRAIGAFDFLFGRVVTRYAAIRTIRFPERELLLSLTGLVRTVHVDGQLLQLLNYDLSRLDQRNSIAACSPASDNMGEISQNTASHSDDEIERILSSGNSMDQQVMARVLRKITCNLKEHVGSSQLHSDSYSVWFHRLRSFDESTFDAVLNEWLTSCLSTHQVEASRIVLPHLVASGCIALTGFLDLLQAHVSKSKTGQPELTFQTAVKGLESLLPTRDLVSWCSPQDAYRYRLDQYKLCFETDARMLRFVCEVVELAQSSPSQQLQTKLSHLLAGEPVLSILKHCILVSPGCLSKLRPANLSRRTVDQFLQSSLSTLIDPFGHLCLSSNSPEQRVLPIFSVASELSMPFCQAYIEQLFGSDTASVGDSKGGVSAALLDAIKMALEKDQPAGLELLAALDTSLTDQIRQHAEREVLEASRFLTSPSISHSQEANHIPALSVQKYLTVIDLTSGRTVETADQSTLLPALIERVKGIAQVLNNLAGLEEQSAGTEPLPVPELYTWLHALFRITVAHAPALLRNASQQHQMTLMVTLKFLVTHPVLEMHPSITEHILDVAVFLSDYTSDDVRNQLARLESIGSKEDPFCSCIFGTTTPVDGWLVLTKPVSHIQTPSQAQAQAQAQTQPQHQLSAPTSNQSLSPQYQGQTAQTPGPGAAANQQRYLNQQRQQQQQQQQQQQMQAHQAQQMRNYPSYPPQTTPQTKMLPAQLSRASSNMSAHSPLQQMQHMQHMQGLAQQRATQPSPVSSQRPAPATGMAGAMVAKLQTRQEREVRQYPFVQPRWEILAESSGNPNANETAINLSLFGARRA